MLDAIIVAAAVSVAQPFQPSSLSSTSAKPLVLKPGEATFVVIEGDGQTWSTVGQVEAVLPGAIERTAAALQSTPEAQTQETLTQAPGLYAQPDHVKLSFAHFADRAGVILLVENGYRRRLAYKAVMHRGARSAPTSVCSVAPGIVGVESWGDDLDAIELGSFTLDDSTDPTPMCR